MLSLGAASCANHRGMYFSLVELLEINETGQGLLSVWSTFRRRSLHEQREIYYQIVEVRGARDS